MENLRLEKASIEHEIDFVTHELQRIERRHPRTAASAPPSASPATLRARK